MRPLLLVALLPALATAQSGHPLFPLEEGTVLEYERGRAPSDSYGPYILSGYERHTMLGDTTVGGATYRVVSVDRYGADYAPEGTSRCGARVSGETGRVEWVALDSGPCLFPEFETAPDFRTLGTEARAEHVGRERLTLDVATNVQQSSQYAFAEGVGLLAWTRNAGTPENDGRLRLVHAQVGGETLGRPFDSDDWKAFYSLAEGDVREYRAGDSHRFGGSEGDEVWYVRQDTTIDQRSYRLVQVVARGTRWFDGDTTQTRTDAVCALRLAEDTGRAEWAHVRGDGDCPGRSVDLRPTWDFSEEPVLGSLHDAQESRPYVSSPTVVHQYARGIGPTTYVYRDFSGPGGGESAGFRLVYAEIDGVAYGTPDFATGADEHPAPRASFHVGPAFPNPTTGAASLALTLPRGEAEVAVYDVLGRQVRCLAVLGSQDAVRFDLGGLPAGTYAVRVTTDSGDVAVRTLTKAE